jgi:hypothetical protein
MFKKYRMKYRDGNIESFVDFYVHYDKANGLRACVLGPVPRDDLREEDYEVYRKHTARLDRSRCIKRKAAKFKREAWAGQSCLSALWDRLDALPFTDMCAIHSANPFNVDEEPKHIDIIEPADVFEKGGLVHGE